MQLKLLLKLILNYTIFLIEIKVRDTLQISWFSIKIFIFPMLNMFKLFILYLKIEFDEMKLIFLL